MSERYYYCYDNALRNLHGRYASVIVQFGVVQLACNYGSICGILGVTIEKRLPKYHRKKKYIFNQQSFTRYAKVHKIVCVLKFNVATS